jgi:signal transduction histidine kinase
LGASLLPSAGVSQFVRTPQGRMRVAAFSDMGTGMRVAVPPDRLDQLVRALAIIFLAGLPVMLLFIVVGGRWIAKQALGPVRRIADEAEGITSKHLYRRVSVPAAEDEIRRLALVLNATLARLEMSFQQAMRFSADASHELKTPLTVLHSDIEALLASPTLCDSDRAVVADILETAKRLNAITKNLLLLARTDAGRLHLDLQPVDFAQVINDCVYDARIMAEARELTLEAELPEKAVVLGEEVRLSQIVSNLLDNAVKYNTPGGKIRVSLTPSAGSWALKISNTGLGIPPGQAPRIFERFHRGERHAEISGHGLGLSLCSELARAHGSKIELVHSGGGWTTFRFVLGQAGASDA